MFKVGKDYTIEMIDGDTGKLKINFDNYQLQTGDKLYLSVSSAQASRSRMVQAASVYIFQEVLRIESPSTSAVITITPEDTKGKDGEYIYDVQLTTSEGYVDTIIPPSKFIIKRGVTNE